MKKIGDKGKAKYWGEYIVRNIVELRDPVACHSDEIGKALFKPTIAKIEWLEKPPSRDQHDIWFPYWIVIKGREKFGQFAPMIGQKALLELLKKAVKKGFFSVRFLRNLKRAIEKELDTSKPSSREYTSATFRKLIKEMDKIGALTPVRMKTLIKYMKAKINIAWLCYPTSPSAKAFRVYLKDAKYDSNLVKKLSNWGRGGYGKKYRQVYIRNMNDATIVAKMIKGYLKNI